MEKFVMLIHLQSALTAMLKRLREWIERQRYMREPPTDGEPGQVLGTDVNGGRVWVKVEQAGAAEAALETAQKYTDQKIKEIPTPDVSGKIQEHNEDENAHPNIQEQLRNKPNTGYVDEKVSKTRMELLGYTDQQISNTLLSAREYADTRMEGAEAYADTVGQSTLTEAKTHANTKDREFYLQTRDDLSAHNNNPDAHPEIHQEIGDQMAVVLNSAKTQIESGISVQNVDGSAHPWILTEAKDYTDQKIAELPQGGGMDISLPFPYDYMPEGYPKKSGSTIIETTFTSRGMGYEAVGTGLLKEGVKYVVIIDGVSVETTAKTNVANEIVLSNGNGEVPARMGVDNTIYVDAPAGEHTVKIISNAEVEKLALEFLPTEPIDAALEEAKAYTDEKFSSIELPEGGSGKPGVVMDTNEPAAYEDGTHPVWLNPNGDYVLTAEDFGADPLGSADSALVEAKAYADEKFASIEIPEGGEKAFVVNFVITRNAETGKVGFSSVDKTFAEVHAAVIAGKSVYANVNELDANGEIDTSKTRVARVASYRSAGIEFVAKGDYDVNLRINFLFTNTALIEEWEDDNVRDLIYIHDTSISAHWDIRTKLTEMQTAIDGIPTLEQNVAAVLAALPTWTGGSY